MGQSEEGRRAGAQQGIRDYAAVPHDDEGRALLDDVHVFRGPHETGTVANPNDATDTLTKQDDTYKTTVTGGTAAALPALKAGSTYMITVAGQDEPDAMLHIKFNATGQGAPTADSDDWFWPIGKIPVFKFVARRFQEQASVVIENGTSSWHLALVRIHTPHMFDSNS